MTQPSIFHRIATLLPELEELERHPGGPRSPRTGTPTTDTSRLPFGIIIDDPDEPADALTTDGIQAWAAWWAAVITTARGELPTLARQRAAGKERANIPLTYLESVADWCSHEFPDWEALRDEAQRIHARLARRTGHGYARYGWCSCGGNVWQKCTDEGLSDWMVCDGPAEHFFKDAFHYADAQRGMARAVTQEGRYWVTMAHARSIWPGLKKDTLLKWVKRGHVAASAGRYDLAQINKRMATLAQPETA